MQPRRSLLLSNDERIDLILLAGTSKTYREIAAEFSKRHPYRPPVCHGTVGNIIAKFKATGSVLDKRSSQVKKDEKDNSQAAAIRETFQKTFGKQNVGESDKSKDSAHRVIRQANGFRYAVVDIDANTGDELYDLLVDNGFNNFVFLNNLADHPQFCKQSTSKETPPVGQPQIGPQSPMPYAHVQSAPERCSSPLFELPKEEVDEVTDELTDDVPFFEEVSATDLLGEAEEPQKQPVYSTEVVTLSDSRSPSPSLVEKEDTDALFNSSNASTTDGSETEYIAVEPVNKPKSKVGPKGNAVHCLLCKNMIMVSRFTNLTNHARRHAVIKKYRCYHCAFQHNEHARIRSHMVAVHQDETTDVIDNGTPANVKLWNYLVRKCFPHYIDEHNAKKKKIESDTGTATEKKYKCMECGEEFAGPDSANEDGSALLTFIENHLKTSHNVECMECVCLVCGYEHADQWNVRWHLSVRHSDVPAEKNFVMLPKSSYRSLVTKFFPSAAGFIDSRVNTREGNGRPSSSHEKSPGVEPAQYSDADLSDIEQDGSFKSSSLPCRLCNRFFELDGLTSIVSHAKAHYVIKQFECDQCGYGSNNKTALSQHVYFKHRRRQVKIVEHDDENMRKAWTQVVRTCFPGLAAKLENRKEGRLEPVPTAKNAQSTIRS